MKRSLIGCLAAVMALALMAPDAAAQRRTKGGGKGKKAAEAQVPTSPEISRSMGEVRWGMTKDEVVKQLEKGIADRYRPQLATARDAVAEDRIRDAARDEIRALRASYIRFDGNRTGWDASFLRDEFTHGNGESLVTFKDNNSQNFYFFFHDRLWKWFKAFNSDVFEGQNFHQFQSALGRRFGEGRETTGELSPGGGQRHWVEWQDDDTRLRAVDLTGFYGFYCMVFEEKATLQRLATLRPSSGRERRGNSLVDAVTTGDHYSQDHDDSPNIVDRLTGRIRAREDAPASTGASGGSGRGGSAGRGSQGSTSRAPASSTPTVDSSDDPLSGLGL